MVAISRSASRGECIRSGMDQGAATYEESPGNGAWHTKLESFLTPESRTHISFNLDGISNPVASARAGKPVDPSNFERLTGWELYQVSQSPHAWDRITWYRGVVQLTIHSDDAASSASLFRSERTFTVWRYGVGHSQLLLRAVPDSANTACLDLLFEDVKAVQLVTHYESIELHPAGEDEAQQILDFSGLASTWRGRHLAVSLRSRSGSGFVLCRRITALHGGDDPFGPHGGVEERDVMWSIRR